MEEFEIKPGERLPKETLMEMPEQSFAQELMCKPVPFENRIEYLSSYVKPTSRKLRGCEIAKNLGVSENVVLCIARDINAPTTIDAEGDIHFGVYTQEIIEDELECAKSFDTLPDMLSKFSIAEYLATSWTWVTRQAADLNVYPEPTEQNGRIYLLYPKSLVQMLRTLQLHVPLANDEYTITELEDITGKEHRWIEKIASKHDVQLLLRTNLTSHEMTYHYPAYMREILLQEIADLPPPAGEWLTMNAIAHVLNRSRSWVASRLASYESVAEERLTVQSKAALHYSPSILEELRILAEKEDQEKVGWFSDTQIASLAGKSIYWVRARTKMYTEEVQYLPSDTSNKKIARHYPERIAEKIIAIGEAEPLEAESLITVEEIAKMVNRTRGWVTKRIGQLGIESEIRLDRRMKARQHYDAEVVDMLQLHYMIDEENKES